MYHLVPLKTKESKPSKGKEMSKSMLLYKNITVLSREQHKALKLKTVEGFGFAADTHWLPIAGAEFYQAARYSSIVFVSEGPIGRETITPILLTGLEAGRNDYVSKDGKWKENTYLPAFVRRYPFVVAAQDENADELTICFDAAFSGFNKEEGTPLFNEDGTNSALLDEAIQFMTGFNVEMKRTREFAELLLELDLLERRSAEIRSNSGEVFHIQDFLLVNEAKLAKLTGDQLANLNEKGFLGWVFAHLMSLGNLPDLLSIHLSNKK